MQKPYPIWDDVPVMFDKCSTDDQRLRHRLRRAAQKAEDRGLGDCYEIAELMYQYVTSHFNFTLKK